MATELQRGQRLRCPVCGSGYGRVRPYCPSLEITQGFTKFAVLPLSELPAADLVKCKKCHKVRTVEEWRESDGRG